MTGSDAPAARSTAPARLRLSVMGARDPHEKGRVATPLELFFDLVFVVAVSIAAVQLHHALSEGHVLDGLLSFAFVFFAIWWAWMNFTWFATSFGTDDWLYRVLTILQMSGVLILAAGVEPLFHGDFLLSVIGYVVMRVAMIAQWLRAAHHGGEHRRTARTYAAGIAIVQVLWLVMFVLPSEVAPFAIPVLILAELAVPVVAERRVRTPWHAHHITERYGLFTLILLGESLLASANAIIEALHGGEELGPLIAIAVLTLVVTAGLWWIYFWPPHHRAITSFGSSLRYGYGHYVVFAAAAAFSAGIEVEIDAITHAEGFHLDPLAASFTVTVPIALFILGIWLLAIRRSADGVVNIVVPVGAVLVLLDPVLPIPVAISALVVAVIVAVLVIRPPVADPHPGR